MTPFDRSLHSGLERSLGESWSYCCHGCYRSYMLAVRSCQSALHAPIPARVSYLRGADSLRVS